MEFTVSKTDLVRELSLSQGVVEKKTTIPILSNVLLEASGERVTLTATDLELGIRCSCPARIKPRRPAGPKPVPDIAARPHRRGSARRPPERAGGNRTPHRPGGARPIPDPARPAGPHPAGKEAGRPHR